MDTVLDPTPTRPGLTLDGQVDLVGGDAEADIEQVSSSGWSPGSRSKDIDTDHAGTMEFHRMSVSGALQLAPKQQSPPVPAAGAVGDPITDVYGQRLHGMTMGLRTELGSPARVDKRDLDQVAVHPLPVHERILGRSAGSAPVQARRPGAGPHPVVSSRRCRSTRRSSSSPPPRSTPSTIREVELTFCDQSAAAWRSSWSCDKRGGFPSAPGTTPSAATRCRPHRPPTGGHWAAQVVDGWLRETTSRYGSLRSQYGPSHGHSRGTGWAAWWPVRHSASRAA